MTPRILIIYTGGTIGMMQNPITKALEPFNFLEIEKSLAEIKLIDCDIKHYEFEKLLDSSNIEPKNWKKIAQVIEQKYEQYDGFVVLHGTDTMAFTTSALSFMLNGLQKPVIFTGSQLPIGHLRTDAKENLITSLQLAAMKDEDGSPLITEVCLYFQHKLYRGSRISKVNSEQFNAFESPNFPPLAESGVHISICKELLLREKAPFSVNYNLSDNVFILHLFPGLKVSYMEEILNIEGLKGVLMLSFGSGNAPSTESFISSLEKAVSRGLCIVNVTQCSKGAVSQGDYEVSEKLGQIGIISGGDMTSEAALTKMMFLLGNRFTGDKLEAEFKKSLKGEVS